MCVCVCVSCLQKARNKLTDDSIQCTGHIDYRPANKLLLFTASNCSFTLCIQPSLFEDILKQW